MCTKRKKRIFSINKEWVKILLIVLGVFSLSSCSTKKIAYLQGTSGSELKISDTAQASLYDARIKPKDLLTITVNTFDGEVSVPFNLLFPAGYYTNHNTASESALQRYLVDNDGTIDFPVLGRLNVVGKTKSELENLLKEKLKPYLKEDPVVNVRMVNYKISVMGEVNRPSTYTVTNEKVNVLEALAMAGDLTIYGKRDNVKLIRESDLGVRDIFTLDLTDPNLINSPYFYLQQNDVVYVEPNRTKKRSSHYSSMTGQILTGVSVAASVASLVITILRK
jgi:polysaccharide biosynthesis/export protein